jgi:hypothetical protein
VNVSEEKEIAQFMCIYLLFRRSRITLATCDDKNSATVTMESPMALPARQAHESTATSLKNKTAFQKRLEKSTQYKSALAMITSRKVAYRMHEDENFLDEIYSLEDELKWRLASLFAVGYTAYTFAEKMPARLEAEGLCRILKPSKKTISLAKKLLKSAEDDGFTSKSLDLGLTRILKSDPSIRPSIHEIISVTEAQKRKFAVRECALQGQRELLPLKSKNGRFFPEVVVEILDYIGVPTDLRTTQLLMSDYDISNQSNEIRRSTFPLGWYDYYGETWKEALGEEIGHFYTKYFMIKKA